MLKPLVTFLLLSISVFLFGQSDICESGYMPFSSGISFEMTSYNAKGKVTSVTRHDVSDVVAHGDGFRALVTTEVIDEKGKPVHNAGYYIDCFENEFRMDMSSMLAQESLAAVSAMEVTVSGDGLSLPRTLSVGQTLPDGDMEMKASLNGMQLMKFLLTISDRHVVSSETLTTPAGTFDCVKMTQLNTLSGLGSRSYQTATWLAPGKGTVRIETYDKKGQLDSYSELTHFSKN